MDTIATQEQIVRALQDRILSQASSVPSGQIRDLATGLAISLDKLQYMKDAQEKANAESLRLLDRALDIEFEGSKREARSQILAERPTDTFSYTCQISGEILQQIKWPKNACCGGNGVTTGCPKCPR